MATGSCIQLRWKPWENCGVGYILGIPAKIFSSCMLYIPRAFWDHYGFHSDSDRVIRRVKEDQILFLRADITEQLPDGDELLHVHCHRVHIPPRWVKQQDLKIDDTVWLVGADDGVLVLPQQWFQFKKSLKD
jgi:hypothetical protein